MLRGRDLFYMPRLGNEDWILVAIGTAVGLVSVPIFRMFWSLWRHGVEVRATVVRVIEPELGDIQFEDQAGRNHLIENCTPPRFGKFRHGSARVLTYLPWNPARWEWGGRNEQRFRLLFGFYFIFAGVGLIGAGLKSLFTSQPPREKIIIVPRHLPSEPGDR